MVDNGIDKLNYYDPLISLNDWLIDTLHMANSYSSEIGALKLLTPSGASVRIREAPPTENDDCLRPARFD